ncbi:enoyl-CoA hydratase-related protein [Pseudokordiimonas caeni]|uniref:enoyl-CoA hydratase-related protein n=1 Tax=Pseudokordiimonas caeni TaxID=2997908 RepID=UPI002812220D|nr:enoyl-CoA hydratase-related protein [Pseudokordiimonas caeni]
MIEESLERGVLTLWLARPEARNALTAEMVDGLMDGLKAAADDAAVRVVVIRGRGGFLSAGADLKGMGAGGKGGVITANRRFGQMVEAAERFPKPLVVVAEGAALGGGFGLLCAADVAIAEAGCKFGMPEVTRGLIPAQIAPFVVARIGHTQARRLALTGEMIDGAEAERLGLVHHVETGAEAVEARLAKVLALLLGAAPGATFVTKALLAQMAVQVDAAMLDRAALLFTEAAMSAEGAEGMRAFAEKRKPSWAEEDA